MAPPPLAAPPAKGCGLTLRTIHALALPAGTAALAPCAVGRCPAPPCWVIAYPRTYPGIWSRRTPISVRIVSVRCDRHGRMWAARWKLPLPDKEAP